MPESDLEAVIRGRRTHKRFDPEPIPSATLERLLELACWAPQHRLSNPWRFTVLQRPALDELASWLPSQAAVVDDPDPEKGPRKVAKLCEHYLPQLAALILVTWRRQSDELVDREDHAASAAAVQNLLLGAHAAGLASFWASSAALRHPETLRHLGIDPEAEGFVAAVFLGGRRDDPRPPARAPLAEVTRWL